MVFPLLFQFLSILLCFSIHHPLLTISLAVFQNSSSSHLCHHADKMALLRFKNGFTIDRHFSEMYADVRMYATSYPKTKSWKKSSDCCTWDGVTCDPISGHVLGLDLSVSQLGGIIHHNSTLFHLSHLRSLNLAYNDFHPSRISPKFGHFPNLKVLNLSHSGFTGVVPVQFSLLSRLVSLDLTLPSIIRDDYFCFGYDQQDGDQVPFTFLGLEILEFGRITRNVTNLRKLHLNGVLINSTLPETLVNLSSLSSLELYDCKLQGVFHTNILTLPRLSSLTVDSNPNLYIKPSMFKNMSSSLEQINFSNTSLSGSRLPEYALESRPPQLRKFIACSCNISGAIPLWIWNTTEVIYLEDNHFTGELPSAVNRDELSRLILLDLSHNLLKGPLPQWLWNLPSLLGLSLSHNQFNGEFIIEPSPPKANLPHNLFYLDISSNRIQGEIPIWFHGIGENSLGFLNISHNNFTGRLDLHSWKTLDTIDLRSNSLQGLLPLPPPSTITFLASNNKFHGEITSSFCNLTLLLDLDLSKNHLSGNIPQCFGKLSSNLEVLDLGSNRLHGVIPKSFTKNCTLKSIHLKDNQFEGEITRTLKRCKGLQVLDLGNNRFNDSFPHWLGNLPEFKVLVLKSNNFQGPIKDRLQANKNLFPKLQILDLSENKFCGNLPARYIQNFKALKVNNGGEHTKSRKYISDFNFYEDSLVLTIKGMSLTYKILTILAALDFSNNRFSGEIPTSVGELVALVAFNISHNQLTGLIPPSLANLTSLESLDLSCNKLEGRIPSQLVSLTFLEDFNVSKNLLTGPIPQGAQFNTFLRDSYEGNAGLCGYPLPDCRNRGELDHPTPPSQQEKDDIIDIITSISLWKIILMGYGVGAMIGLIAGCRMLSTGRPAWFSKKADRFEHVMVQRHKKHSRRQKRKT